MKITGLSAQVRDKNRVNVMVDGSYRFSLDISQVLDLGIKIGKEFDEAGMAELEQESQYGKTYNRALEYALVRPRSEREMRDYLYKKTRDVRTKLGNIRPGVSKHVTDRVFDRLIQRGYVDDEKFAVYWVENRHVKKGISRRKLSAELSGKGVDAAIVNKILGNSDRDDQDELGKVIEKKRHRYDDEKKLIVYLQRQGFSYEDIRRALDSEDD